MSALFRGITLKHEGDFYCSNCFQSYTTKNKLKKHKKVCGKHVYCYVEMPEEDNKILKYNQGEMLLAESSARWGSLLLMFYDLNDILLNRGFYDHLLYRLNMV